MRKQLTCVACPLGCRLRLELAGGEVEEIRGNRCRRGEAYARQEAVEPLRVLTTSVKVEGGTVPLVSVRTDRPVPLRLIPQAMELARGLSLKAPVQMGRVIVWDLLGTGAKLVATRAVPARPLQDADSGSR
ncbi:MAG: DUF1667 domain-containing protein [Candidatus Bipolaricaulaceae bacterium]